MSVLLTVNIVSHNPARSSSDIFPINLQTTQNLTQKNTEVKMISHRSRCLVWVFVPFSDAVSRRGLNDSNIGPMTAWVPACMGKGGTFPREML